MTGIVHFKITVTGKVQGVFYRALAKAKAEELDIKGYIRNESDGSVYIEAEGQPTDLQLFISWCQLGPSGADVAGVSSEGGELKNYERFEIQRW
jgi:acylphosphatase